MSVLSKYQKGKKFDYVIPKDITYKKLEELYNINPDEIYTVRGLYINTKSKYGESPVIATNDFMANVPNHKLNQIKEMLMDSELIEAVNNGQVGFKVYQYEKENKIYFSIEWVDITDDLPF